MNLNKKNESGTTRRRFVKQLTFGGAGVATASRLGISAAGAAQAP